MSGKRVFSGNIIVIVCVAITIFLSAAIVVLVSPHVKILSKTDANDFLSPWDTRPAPPQYARKCNIINPAHIAVSTSSNALPADVDKKTMVVSSVQ